MVISCYNLKKKQGTEFCMHSCHVIRLIIGQKHTTETPSSKEPQNISKDNVEFMATNRDNDTTDVISSTIGMNISLDKPTHIKCFILY